MAQRSRHIAGIIHTRFQKETGLGTAVAAALGIPSNRPARGFVWGFVASLSALCLAAAPPAGARDGAFDGWKETPREPDSGETPRRAFGMPRRFHETLGRDGREPRIRLAANDQPDGEPKRPFDVPAGNLEEALILFSRQSGLQIASSSDIVGSLRTRGVQGDFTAEEALRRLLDGTGLQYRFTTPGAVTLQPAARSEGADTPQGIEAHAEPSKPVKVPEIVVKDTRQRMPVVDLPDGYKADVSSEAVLRFPASIQELPQSVSVVTQDSIHDRRAVTLQQAVEGIAGVTKASQLGGSGTDSYIIRGFISSANTPGSTRDNGLAAFNNYVGDPTLYDRIEVFKGPASFTSGLVAAGGFVNRLLKAPQQANFVVSEFGGGSAGHYRTTLDANGVMPNLPIAGRFVFTQNEDPEFFRNTGNQRFSFLPSVRFSPREDFTFTLTGNVQRLRGKGYYGTPTTIQGLIPAGIEDSFLGNDNSLKIDYHSIHAEAEKKFVQGFRLKAKGQYSHDDTSYRYAYGYASGGIGPTGNFNTYAYGRDFRRESFVGEINLTKEFSLFGNLSSVAAGMDYSVGRRLAKSADFLVLGSGNITNPRVNFPFPPGFTDPAAALSSDLRYHQTGAFVQGLLRPFAGTTLMVALRGNWITQQQAFSGAATGDSLNVSKLTPQIGLSQRVIEGLNVYASYGESILPNFALVRNGEILDPQTGKTIELGTKWEPLGQRLRLTAALFRTDLDNVATRNPFSPTFSIGGQSQRNQGFEFQAQGAPVSQLQLNLAYTFLDTEITKSTIDNIVGARAFNAPTHTVSAFGTYDLSELLTKGLKLGAVVYYRSEVSPFPGPNQNQTYESYTRADLFAIYAPLSWLSLQVNVNNIADARYVESPQQYSAYNQFGAPRHVIGMVRMTF